MIRRSLQIKKVVIEQDEYESDLRRILNYGHTFGHALEALSGHAVPHGLGVVWGIDLVNHLSVRRGFPVEELKCRLHEFIDRNLSFDLAEFPSAEELIDMTRRDKKVAAGQLNLVLLRGPGDLVIEPTPFDDHLTEGVHEFLEATGAVHRN
jgi:3-dehydroquinate synthase